MTNIDPRLGTWKLNVARSRFSPACLAAMKASRPVEETAVFRETGEEEIELSVSGTRADGTTTAIAVSFPRQGGAGKVRKGALPKGMTIVSTVFDPRYSYATCLWNGRQVFVAQSEISRDGSAMRVTTKGTDTQGTPVEQRLLFRKQ